MSVRVTLIAGIVLACLAQEAYQAGLPKLSNPVSTVVGRMKNATDAAKDTLTNTEERTFTDYYHGGHKYARVITDKKTKEVLDCMLIGDREFIAYMIGDQSTKWTGPVLELANDLPQIEVINVTTDVIDDFIDRCDGIDTQNDTRPGMQKFFSALGKGPQTILKYAVIFPGTKWCGAGNVARNYDDLGSSKGTDKCCRDHDNSVENLARGEEKEGIKNTLLYTMTKCPDDNKFNQCLTDTQSVHASAVGSLFFNVLKTKCYDKRKQSRCAKQLLKGLTPCKEYVYDEDSPETWQIFDATPFVPNTTLPTAQINKLLHSAPGVGDFIALVS